MFWYNKYKKTNPNKILIGQLNFSYIKFHYDTYGLKMTGIRWSHFRILIAHLDLLLFKICTSGYIFLS